MTDEDGNKDSRTIGYRPLRYTNLNPPRRLCGILFTTDVVQLSRSDVGVPCKLPDFVHTSPVSEGIRGGRFAKRMNADAASTKPVGGDSGDTAIVLHKPP